MGFLRLYLALSVLVWHTPPITERWLPYSHTAVICFFIISGFYISMVLNEHYAKDTPGFYLNRAVRLFPLYWACMLLLVAMNLVGIGPNLLDQSPESIIGQLLIVPRVLWDSLTLNADPNGTVIYPLFLGQMYTVGLEILFYAIAPFFVRRSLPVLLVIFVISVGLHGLPYWQQLPARPWQYEFFTGIFMFFVIGSLSYRLYRLIRDIRWAHWVGFITMPVIFWHIWHLDQPVSVAYVNDVNVYTLYALVALSIPFLFAATKQMAKYTPVDAWVGNLSYPLYAVHLLPVWIFTAAGITDIWWTRAAAVGMAIVLAICVENPVERLRSLIRKRKRLPSAEAVSVPV